MKMKMRMERRPDGYADGVEAEAREGDREDGKGNGDEKMDL